MRIASVVFAAATTFAASAAPAADTPPHARAIMLKMQAALAPARASSRAIDVVVTSREGETVQWAARELRKTIGGSNAILTVFDAPASVAGFAVLTTQAPDGTHAQWAYVPFVRRVRKVLYEGHHQPFLGTDFTLADLGCVLAHQQNYALLATEEYAGRKAYKIREEDGAQSPYSHVVTWVAVDSFLPLRREFYDVAGQIWKIQLFENVTVIDGTPTPLKIRMTDEQQKGSTELTIREVRYDVELSDDQFDPMRLPAVAQKH